MRIHARQRSRSASYVNVFGRNFPLVDGNVQHQPRLGMVKTRGGVEGHFLNDSVAHLENVAAINSSYVSWDSKREIDLENGISIVLICGSLAAWFQHLYTCFNEEVWGFLIAGAIFFPVAIVHGIGIWIGIW